MMLIKKTGEIPTFMDGSIIWINEKPYRILSHQGKDDDTNVWMIELLIDTYHIVKIPLHRLIQMVSENQIVSGEDTEAPITPVLKEGDRRILEARYIYIQHYVSKLYPNYSILQQRAVPKPDLQRLAEACHLSEDKLRKYIRRYLQGGGTLISIVDKRFVRTKKPNYNPYAGKVRGRKRNGTSSTVQNDEVLFSFYEAAYKEFQRQVNKNDYTASDKYKPTLKSVYNAMIIKFYSTTDENSNFVLLPEEQRPSERRFYNWVRNHKLNGNTIRNYATSARDRRNNNRLLVGNSHYGVARPMEIVEIDENKVSNCLISANPATPLQAIGNPVVYIAIDVLTHRIVGMSVGFEDNSYEGVLNLFDSMMMTDEENARILGTLYDQNHPVFPGCVLPNEIRVDHGAEYTSHALSENLTGGARCGTLEGIPVIINLAPVATGSMKGVVERFFGELHRRIQNAAHSEHGYVTGTHRSRHNEEAVMTIETFRKVAYEVVKAFNDAPMPDYPVTPSLDSKVPERTPNALWNHYAKAQLCGFDVSDSTMRMTARYGLMKRDKSFKLSKKQISYKNVLFWDIQDDRDLVYDAIQLGDASKTVDVRYDPRSVDLLYRLDKNGIVHTYHLAAKRPAMEGFAHLRWAIVEPWIQEECSKRYKLKKQKEEVNIQTEAIIGSHIKESVASKPAGKNTKKNKKEAIQLERTALAAYDANRKREIFHGDTMPLESKLPATSEISEKQESTTDESIVELSDPTDIEAIIRLYGIQEDNQ